MRPKLLPGLALLFVAALVAACSGSTSPTPSSTPVPSPTAAVSAALATTTPVAATLAPVTGPGLQFIGHDSTLIVASDGTRVISDPYDLRPFGLPEFPKGITANVVTVSHAHSDNNNSAAVGGNPKVILTVGTTQVGAVKITGYTSDHGVANGISQGRNIVFVMEFDGIKVVHLGAAGLISQSDILAAIKGANVAILDAVGDEGHPVVQMLRQLQEAGVQVIVPAHYSIDPTARFSDGEGITMDEFLAQVPSDMTVVKQGSILALTATLPKEILVMTPAVLETK